MDVKFIVFLVIVGVVAYATFRINPKGPKNGLGKVIGYVMVFASLLVLANTALPRFLTKQSGNMDNWDPFWGRMEGSAQGAAALVNEWLVAAPAPPESPPPLEGPGTAVPTANETPAPSSGPLQYIVTAGDSLSLIAGRYGITVDELRTANNLTGDLIVPGQILQIPVDVDQAGGGAPDPDPANTAVPPDSTPDATKTAEPANTAVPATPEPTSDNTAVKAQIYQDLAAAKAAGNIRAGEAAVATLFSLNINDPTAVTANDEIRTARELASRYDGLANETDHEKAKSVMYGRTFLVIDDGAATLVFSSCNETATVQQVTQDWLRGYTFQIRRCVMSGYGDGTPATGETFTVK